MSRMSYVYYEESHRDRLCVRIYAWSVRALYGRETRGIFTRSLLFSTPPLTISSVVDSRLLEITRAVTRPPPMGRIVPGAIIGKTCHKFDLVLRNICKHHLRVGELHPIFISNVFIHVQDKRGAFWHLYRSKRISKKCVKDRSIVLYWLPILKFPEPQFRALEVQEHSNCRVLFCLIMCLRMQKQPSDRITYLNFSYHVDSLSSMLMCAVAHWNAKNIGTSFPHLLNFGLEISLLISDVTKAFEDTNRISS